MTMRNWLAKWLAAALLLGFAMPAVAQQTGTLEGVVTTTDGSALPGVTVEAASEVLPQPASA